MTWYATEILARCNPALLVAVKNDPILAAHAYLIHEPLNYSFGESEVIFTPPDGGLLVIRPVCDPETHCAEWHDTPVLSWDTLADPGDIEVIGPQAFGEHIESDLNYGFPPPKFLAYLKKLSSETNSRLAFFFCCMWAGETEIEYLWLFGERNEAAIVLEPGVKSKVVQVGEEGDIVLRDADLLSEALSYLGAPILSPFWAPHTRSFPWERYKLL